MAEPFKALEQMSSNHGNSVIVPDNKINERSKKKNREEELAERVPKALGEIFDQFKTGEERSGHLLKDFKPLLNEDIWDKDLISEEVAQEIIEDLNKCAEVQEKEKFIEHAAQAIKPLIDAKISFPKKFEAWERALIKKKNEGSTFFVNEIIHYELLNEQLLIHVAPAETFSVKEKIRAVRDGLKKIQEVVKDDKSIKEIIGTSWITGENPGLAEKFGFTISEIDEETRQKHFADETRKVNKAFISRDDFIKKDYNKI